MLLTLVAYFLYFLRASLWDFSILGWIMKKILLINILLIVISSTGWAEVIFCNSQVSPIELYVNISDNSETYGKFSLKVNLENPNLPPTNRIVGPLTSAPNSSGEWIISDSYIHGVTLVKNNKKWSAQIQIFEEEAPILLNCR